MIPKKNQVPVSADGFRRTTRQELKKYKEPAAIYIQDDESLIVYYVGDANYPQGE
jgi:CMP-N-acetylneuraminic acid synthetase